MKKVPDITYPMRDSACEACAGHRVDDFERFKEDPKGELYVFPCGHRTYNSSRCTCSACGCKQRYAHIRRVDNKRTAQGWTFDRGIVLKQAQRTQEEDLLEKTEEQARQGGHLPAHLQ